MRSTARLRVMFADTDAAGIVHYARFLAYFETARAEVLRQLGVASASIVACERDAHVVEASLRYRAPARFDDELLVLTWVADRDDAGFRFKYEIQNAADGILMVTGETRHVWSHADLPDGLPSALERLATHS